MRIVGRSQVSRGFVLWLVAALSLLFLTSCGRSSEVETSTPEPATAAALSAPEMSLSRPSPEIRSTSTSTHVPPTVTLTATERGTDIPVTRTPIRPLMTPSAIASDAASPSPVTSTPTEVPTPAPVCSPPPAGEPAGTLLYSVVNRQADRWELWEYDFACQESRFLREWRTEVAFSPDYQQVVYYGWPAVMGEKHGIYIAQADLTQEQQVIQGGAYPSFSSDGTRLVANGGDTMYVFRTDGSGLRAIDRGEYPAWSPVDDWIAHRGCYGPECGLWLTHADTAERVRVTAGGSDGQPAWSPDGQHLAYTSKGESNSFDLYTVDRDGSNVRRLTSDIRSQGLPIWSPDGEWIAFRSDSSGVWAIYVIRPDGTDLRPIVDADVLPLWFFEKLAWRP